MFERMDKTWIRLLVLAALMALAAPIAVQAADNDGTIKASVLKALNPYEDVSVSVDNGQVTLKGNVASTGEKAAAISKASSVRGVRGVKDELRVVGADDSQTVGEYVGDAAVTAKIKAELLTIDGLESRHIGVDTRDGVVMLTGSVKNAGQSNMVEQKARTIKGVKSVDNRLVVTP